jgi:general secretion pathway protein G
MSCCKRDIRPGMAIASCDCHAGAMPEPDSYKRSMLVIRGYAMNATIPQPANRRTGGHRSAFTLVELLIVVVILGIMAMIVIPQFSNASHQARENTLKDDLRYLRTQVAVYKAQHRDVAPGTGTGDFIQQMTMPTDDLGNTNATATSVYRFGPYLLSMPPNPLNNKDTIKFSTAADVTADVDDSTGWLYNVNTQQMIANLSGSDDNGVPYKQY